MEKASPSPPWTVGPLCKEQMVLPFLSPAPLLFFLFFLCVAFVSIIFVFMEEKIQAVGRPRPCKVYV